MIIYKTSYEHYELKKKNVKTTEKDKYTVSYLCFWFHERPTTVFSMPISLSNTILLIEVNNIKIRIMIYSVEVEVQYRK